MTMHATAPTSAPVPVGLLAPAMPVPMRVPPSAGWDAAVDRYVAAPRVVVLPCPARRSRDDGMFDFQVKNIMCFLEGFNNGVPEDDNSGAAIRRRWN